MRRLKELPFLPYLAPLGQWIVSYPLLLVTAVLLVGLCQGFVGKSLGIPDLFWHDLTRVQFTSGLGVGVLLFDLGTVGYLFDLDKQRSWLGRLARPRLRWLAPRYARFVRYLVFSSGVLLLLVTLGAFTVVTDVPHVWVLPLGAILMAALLITVKVAAWMRFPLPVPAPPARAQAKLQDLPEDERELHRFAYRYFVGRAAFYLLLAASYALFSMRYHVAFSVCMLLGLVVLAHGALRFYYPDTSFGIAMGVVVGLTLLNALGGHQLPRLSYEEPRPVDELGAADGRYGRHLLDPETALASWRARFAAPPVLVVAAVDGGGIRAAVWSTTVLRELEDDLPRFSEHLRLITGASGGMVGAASWTASLQPPTDSERHRDLAGTALGRDCLIQRVGRDSLTDAARQLVFFDLPVPPVLHPVNDRGYALEQAWERDTNVLGQQFVCLRAGEEAGWRPSLLVSPVIVEDGRRLLISNLDSRPLAAIAYQLCQGPLQSLQAIEFFRSFPDATQLALSSAVRMNAAFPYVSPAAELPTEPARRTVDAGYYDEHGVDLAATWLWTHREWIKSNTAGVLLVQVPDARVLRAKRSDTLTMKRKWYARGLGALTGPIEAVGSSRDAAMRYRNDGWIRTLEGVFNTAADLDFFRTVVFEPDAGQQPASRLAAFLDRTHRSQMALRAVVPDQDVALSWRLTPGEIQRLARGIGGEENCRRRARLRDWWGRRGGVSLPAVAACQGRGIEPCPDAPRSAFRACAVPGAQGPGNAVRQDSNSSQ